MNGNGFETRTLVHKSKDERCTINKVVSNITGDWCYEMYSPENGRNRFNTVEEAFRWMRIFQNRDRK